MSDFENWANVHRQEFQNAFQSALKKALPNFPSRLHNAIEYVSQSSGKMLRPLLCFASAKTFGIPYKQALPYAMAIEAIHLYSLVHDDLPAMDDDNLRRGRPTCHTAFDEATAILVGDALQTLAFNFLAEAELPDNIKIQIIKALIKASGPQGMVGGQMLDIQASTSNGLPITLEALDHLHSLKTGALINAAVQCGLLLQTQPNLKTKTQLIEFGQLIGLAFQIQDDILDVTSSTETLGKPAKSDESSQKTTYPTLLGLQESQERLHTIFKQALEKLDNISEDTSYLLCLAQTIVHRSH